MRRLSLRQLVSNRTTFVPFGMLHLVNRYIVPCGNTSGQYGIMLIVFFCVLYVCKCVLYYFHRVSTQLQLTNISVSTSKRLFSRTGLRPSNLADSTTVDSGEISPTRCNNSVFIRNGFTLHVSGDSLTHHQEYNAVCGHR